jgi:nucleoside-diphosphate-sugar epimerase
MERILVIGACGQLGSELTNELGQLYGEDNVIASDISDAVEGIKAFDFVKLNVMDKEAIDEVISQYQITQIYHLAAILSAKGEEKPLWAWDLNMTGLLNILEAAKNHKLNKVYWPSSIAVFGPSTPRQNTAQDSIMDPNTVYGISKLAGERWCEYYYEKYGVDVRSLRYPGLIGYKSLPGGGTTDYAVDIYHKALANEPFTSFLSEDTRLPMMYMSDAIKATIDLMEAPLERIKVRSSYNIAALSFTPKEIAMSIQRHYPNFRMSCVPDFRQAIADSWPESIDDSVARNDWGWKENFSLDRMTDDILSNLPTYFPTKEKV